MQNNTKVSRAGTITQNTNSIELGSIIENKWILTDRIGKGAMGEVFRANQINLKRDVAIKIISKSLLNNLKGDPDEIDALFTRFRREVLSMASIRHTNVLKIYDYGITKVKEENESIDIGYISMEYIAGDTLKSTMQVDGFDEDSPLVNWLCDYFLPILDGVEAMHKSGIVHRDIKPANILLDGNIPKIADFGLARAAQMKTASNSWDVKGAWSYMAPEQFSDFRKTRSQADIYSLGKILYEAIQGKIEANQIPFTTVSLRTPRTILLKKLDIVIKNATHEIASRRYQNINEMRKAIKSALEARYDEPLKKAKLFPSSKLFWWLLGVISIPIISVAVMTIYHLFD